MFVGYGGSLLLARAIGNSQTGIDGQRFVHSTEEMYGERSTGCIIDGIGCIAGHRIGVCACKRAIRQYIITLLAQSFVAVRQPIGYTTCIRILGKGFAGFIQTIPHASGTVRFEQRQVTQAYVAQARFIAQAARSSLVVAHLFALVHLRIIPTGELKILAEEVRQYG